MTCRHRKQTRLSGWSPSSSWRGHGPGHRASPWHFPARFEADPSAPSELLEDQLLHLSIRSIDAALARLRAAEATGIATPTLLPGRCSALFLSRQSIALRTTRPLGTSRASAVSPATSWPQPHASGTEHSRTCPAIRDSRTAQKGLCYPNPACFHLVTTRTIWRVKDLASSRGRALAVELLPIPLPNL